MNQLMETRDKKENKKNAGALLLSVIIHVVVILLFAIVLTNRPSAVPPPPTEPVELTLMPAPPVEATPPPDPYIATTEAQRSEKPPEEKLFESDKDTLAASEKPPENNLPVPSQEGRDEKKPQFEDWQFSLGPKPMEQMPVPPNQIARPIQLPQIEPKTAETKAEEAKAEATPKPDDLALMEPQPKKTEEPKKAEQEKSATPPSPPPQPQAYRPETRTTRIQGGISNRGRNAVNALATPMGRYKKMLSDAIGSRWYYYVRNDMGLLSIGTVIIRFVVRPDGKVEGVQVISNSSNETFATTSIRSIIEAEIPAIPPEVASVIAGGKLEVDYTFTIMNN